MNQYAGTVQAEGRNTPVCDLRSDTVTRPDAAMRAAMAAAEVGDDVFGDDPTVRRLETALAERLGKEAGLFVTSGTQSNLCAMLAHCARGEEVITGDAYHVHKYEAMGASVLGGIGLCPVPLAGRAVMTGDEVAGAIKADDPHFPVSRLLSLENTHNGQAVPLDALDAPLEAAREAGLATHLDGARFFNAVTALGCSPDELAGRFDTVSICLSKGLGAPVGSVLVGPADLIAKARRWRKMLGGGLRQSGVLAAAGLHALDHHVAGLAEDHARAAALAGTLRGFGAGTVRQDTNMIWFTPDAPCHADLSAHMQARGVLISAHSGPVRLVLHRDVDDAALDVATEGFRSFFGG